MKCFLIFEHCSACIQKSFWIALGWICVSLLLALPADADSSFKDVSPSAEKLNNTLECPIGAIQFGASPPHGFEAWCAKPPATAKDQAIHHGPRILWYANGQKLAEGEYRDGKQFGVATAWHENGQKRIVENFENGLRHGLSTAWYPDGTKQGEGKFERGKEAGLWTWWHPHGQKAVSGAFRAGQRFGVWTYWNENGTVKSTEHYPLEAPKPVPMK